MCDVLTFLHHHHTADFFRCLWQRNVTQTISNICLEPEPLKGLDLDAAAASGDAEVRAQVDGCITKTQTTTTTRVGGAQQDPLLEQMASAAERMGRYVSDASKAAAVILVCGGLVALIVGFIYLLVVQSCAKVGQPCCISVDSLASLHCLAHQCGPCCCVCVQSLSL